MFKGYVGFHGVKKIMEPGTIFFASGTELAVSGDFGEWKKWGSTQLPIGNFIPAPNALPHSSQVLQINEGTISDFDNMFK